MSMCMLLLRRIGVLLSCLLLLLLSIFVIDVDGGIVLSVTSPKKFKQEFSVDNRDLTPAVFGSPKYGSYVNGILFYPNITAHQLACSPIDITKETDRPTDEGVSLIWMVDRSRKDADASQKCSFVTKVRNAQAAGAVAVIVAGYDEQLVYMADDGSSGDVSSPAVMIKNSATRGAKGLKEQIRTPAPTPTDPYNTKFTQIGIQITWRIPTSLGNVKWDLWTSAWDSKSVSLKHLFGRADLELHNNTYFNPRYFYYYGYQMDMDNCVDNYPECGDLCVNQGKYCQHDPDGDDGDLSLTGADIVRENLWQSCVWDILNTTSGGDAHMIRNKWWDYVADFEQECDTADKWRSTTCRDTIMDRYGISKSAVAECRNKCGALAVDSEGTCEMIERDIDERSIKSGIFFTPTLVVNEEAIRGDISCSSPISTSTCNVLSYICQGYLPSTRPAACTAPANGCNFYEKRDCASVCGGSASVDRCGICLGPDDRSRDRTCRDCGGEIHGNRTLDACGICMEPNNSTRDTSCTDCKGVIHGKAKLDQCNVCEGDGKSCQDAQSTSWGAIIAIVLAIAGVVGGVIYLYMRRQQNRMRDDIDGILKQYLPLDGSAGGGGGTGHIRPTQRLDGHENL